MRGATLIIVLTVLGVVLEYPAQPARVRSLAGRASHVAVIGDSYTTGVDLGGLGPKSWPSRTQRKLAQQGVQIVADVAAERGAGYGELGDHGSTFKDLTARAVKPEDALVVFFGSRNDQSVDPVQLADRARGAYDLARRFAPTAKLLVIGPLWPTADVPPAMLMIRDVLNVQARESGAVFVDPIAERWFFDRPNLIGPDRVHPTDIGHAYLADKIAPLIRAQLRP